MKKIRKEFTFSFPLTHKVVRDLRIVTEHVGDLDCECIGTYNPDESVLNIYDRYQVDIDFIKWNGMDIKPVLELTDFIADIEEAALQAFARVIEPSPRINLGKAFDIFKKAI